MYSYPCSGCCPISRMFQVAMDDQLAAAVFIATCNNSPFRFVIVQIIFITYVSSDGILIW